MAKRFTASDKWDDDWFCSLAPFEKLLWLYILDKCDHAGIWKANWKIAKFHLTKIPSLNKFNGKIIKISDDKYFIPKFIEFQYGTLNHQNRLHFSVIEILKKNGISHEELPPFIKEKRRSLLGPSKVLTRSLLGPKDKDKDKDTQPIPLGKSSSVVSSGESTLKRLVKICNE